MADPIPPTIRTMAMNMLMHSSTDFDMFGGSVQRTSLRQTEVG